MYSLGKCREFLMNNNFRINEDDKVRIYTFCFGEKVEYWVELGRVFENLNNRSFNLNYHESIIYNLLLNNEEKLQVGKEFSEVIENNLKKIGFSNSRCIVKPYYNDNTPFGYRIYPNVLGWSSEKTIFVEVGGAIESKLINLEELDDECTFYDNCDLFVEVYNKLVKLYKIENHVEEVKEAVE